MKEPQELRLGNWIYDDDGILCKIIGFQPFDHDKEINPLDFFMLGYFVGRDYQK
ncbi:hypothetical protein [Chryseobacterium indologenes]|uniref:hypothetical protein n=1 Tax=Chryseobacterium indologenes TaxID=253 RepID=UPI000A50183A|nr:hypothetical protein [Chryseobacterium indologenes]